MHLIRVSRFAGTQRRALSLAEVLVSIVLIGGLLTVALETVGASSVGGHNTGYRAQAQGFALQLMTEILTRPFEDPDQTPVFGREGMENASDRRDYDDVDDYVAWSSTGLEKRDGTPVPGHGDWARSVTVEWADPANIRSIVAFPTDVKLITVSVTHDGAELAKLIGLRTRGLPPPSSQPTLLLVVIKTNNLTAQETARKTLIESWDFNVELIAPEATQAEFDAAAGNAAVVYVPLEISDVLLASKLREAPVGVVNEEPELTDEFGIASDRNYVNATQIRVYENTHYIASPFANDFLPIFSSSQPVYALKGFGSIDLQILARTNTTGPNYYPSLTVLDTGASLYGGGTAAGRRVQLPWGGEAFDFDSLNSDGQTIMKRAIEWAGELEEP